MKSTFVILCIFFVLGIVFSSGLQAQENVPGCDVGMSTVKEDRVPSGIPKAMALAGARIVESSAIRDADMDWVNTTLASMTLDEKLGQMMMPWYSSSSTVSDVNNYGIGGCIFSSWNTSGAGSVLTAVNQLQAISPVPLLFSADFECGAGARFGDATVFPMNMGVGAADDEILAASEGLMAAREAWAMGIHVGFGPVVDVNTEPANPVIVTRSYGDDQNLVARMAQAYVSGAEQGGMLTCMKHYPGHGHTDVDSHLALPVVTLSEAELRQVHIYPYEQLILQGFSDFVMSAHVWFTALDPGLDPWPATLSHKAMTEILRTDLGFTGVSISDAFSMAGVSGIMDSDEAVVTAVKNGLDIILIPPGLSLSINALKNAVQTSEIPASQIDDSVRRILIAKSRVWLPEAKYRNETEMWNTLKHSDHLAVSEALARASITRFWEAPGALPLQASQDVLCFRLVDGGIIFNVPARPYTHFTNRLDSALPNFTLQHVNRSLSSGEINSYVSMAASYDRVVVACYDWKPIMTDDQIDLVDQLIAGPTPVVFISFGSPYHPLELTDLETFYCAYCNAEYSQQAGADSLLGSLEPAGTAPVSVYDETQVSLWRAY